MAIFQRASDILCVDFGDMVEESGNPEVVLRQAVIEIEAAIDKAKSEVARAVTTEKAVGEALASNQDQVQIWNNWSNKALAAGDDGLACKANTLLREHERIAAALFDQQQDAQTAAAKLRRITEGLESKLAQANRALATPRVRR